MRVVVIFLLDNLRIIVYFSWLGGGGSLNVCWLYFFVIFKIMVGRKVRFWVIENNFLVIILVVIN